MSNLTVNQADWPKQKDWPKAGWKHALNYQQFREGSIFSWHEDGHLWTGIVEDIGSCSVKVRDVLPGVMQEGKL
jgi:hypothetical protein